MTTKLEVYNDEKSTKETMNTNNYYCGNLCDHKKRNGCTHSKDNANIKCRYSLCVIESEERISAGTTSLAGTKEGETALTQAIFK